MSDGEGGRPLPEADQGADKVNGQLGAPWKPLEGGGVEIAVTLQEVAVRSASHPEGVAVFTTSEWRALARHISDRDDV